MWAQVGAKEGRCSALPEMQIRKMGATERKQKMKWLKKLISFFRREKQSPVYVTIIKKNGGVSKVGFGDFIASGEMELTSESYERALKVFENEKGPLKMERKSK